MDFFLFLLIPKFTQGSSTTCNIKNHLYEAWEETDPSINVPDQPSALATGHSLSVLLLSLLLSFHNSIVLLTIYKPEEQAKVLIHTLLSSP